ncbi:MAG: DUF962 domain-containing protein [Deltaproteobacteria bacterium]|nr:DUF962 domain-containing protein [Deltaproteobacteria bacterium]
MSDSDFKTFEEFWPYYVKEHSKPATRIMHFVGTTAAMACFAGGVLTKRRWLLAVAPVVGYGPAWISHFFIEKNKPATFKYPLWSLRADFRMWGKMARFQMSDEVERVLREEREAAERAEAAKKAEEIPAPAQTAAADVN